MIVTELAHAGPLCSSRRRLSYMSARALRDLGIDPPQSVALGLRGFAELGSLPPIKAPLLPLRAGTERLSSLREDDGNPCNSGPHGCLLGTLNGCLGKHLTRAKFAQVRAILHQTKPSPTSSAKRALYATVPNLS